MNQKQIGVILIIAGVVLLGILAMNKLQEKRYVDMIVEETGTCFREDGTCLHNHNNILSIAGISLSIALVVFGLYLLFFDKTQEKLSYHQRQVSKALRDARKRDEFSAFLSGFSEDEQKILKAIKEQDGILQSTLRYRTGIAKASLSLHLKSLEDRSIVSREVSGKTKKVFLQKKF